LQVASGLISIDTACMSEHPFDESCVEADLVAKVFGGIWNLESDRNRRIWATLLNAVEIPTESFRWSEARLQFSPYPPYHGAEHGKKIGDVVLMALHQLNVVIEAKRPGCTGDSRPGTLTASEAPRPIDRP
jgi:hypothetical protein